MDLFENRWEIEVSYKYGYISVLDHEKRIGFFAQNEEAYEFMDKYDKMGDLEFLDWFYMNEYDLAMNAYNYPNGEP